MADYPYPDPIVRVTGVQELARDLVVIPNRRVQLVPNIGVIGGTHSVLVIDTGMGPRNAEKVLAFAAEYAKGRTLYLTTTHFHPEHAFGARVFSGRATYLVNKAQASDLATKGPGYIGMFTGFGDPVARQLEGVELATPDLVYDDAYDLDLGGRVVHLRATGRAHTKGDQVITVPDAEVMFTGDLVETGQFAIFPWFPPHDTDVSGIRWIKVLERLFAQTPRHVVPGHNDLGGPELLSDVHDYLELLRDETWRRQDSAMSEDTIAEEVAGLMVKQHPDWEGQEWIRPGVGCLCAEHGKTGDEPEPAGYPAQQ
jgi:glyoxylase-like metal-dependent hydrolase (beta-lactamase superfamily II)